MKHINFKSLIVLFLVLFGISPNAWAKYFYLIPSDNWKEVGAKFYFRYWGGSSGEGKQITTEIDGSNIFFFNDEGLNYTGWQFVRVNPSKDEIWTYGPNGVNDKNLCTCNNWDVSWSGNCYRTVAGDNITLFGDAWSADASANDMIPTGSGWTLTKRATLSKGDVYFKVTVDHAWGTSYPKDNVTLTIDNDGKYEVVFTCNGNGSIVNATATPIYSVSYDANGATSGSVPTDATEYLSGSTVTVKSNSGSLAKTGYTFSGWNTNTTGTGTHYDADDEFSITANTTLYAEWSEATTAKVTYDGNGSDGGVVPTDDNTYTHGTTVFVKSDTPTRTGYTFTGWLSNADSEVYKSGDHFTISSDVTLTAQWQAKTYTISFDQNGGEGGQTGTVTATYAAAMPTLENFIAPTRVGYKFKGYYDATSGGNQYYTAAGASACSWNKDANTTLYAQWDQLYCFIEGRFSVATSRARTDWKHVASYFGGWDESSTRIQMEWDSEKNCYKLVTWATMKELSDQQGDGKDVYQYFNIKQSTSSNSLTDVVEYMQEAEGNLTLADKGVKKNWVKHTSEDVIRPHFDGTDRSGFVIIYFDEKQLWFEIDPIALYDVTVQSFNGGSVDPSGTHKIGEISWTITANASEGYHFNRWTTTGGASVENETSASTKVTATANGTVTANFAANTNLYFQKPGKWSGSDVWVYFDAWWDGTKGAGAEGKPAGKKMTDIGNGTYCLTYSGKDDAYSSNIAFVNGQQDYYNPFDNTSVSYRSDFKHCSTDNWFIPDNEANEYKNKHDDLQTAYYNNGYWTSYYDRVEYYFMNSGSKPEWTQLEEYRFKNTDDHNIKRLEIQNITEGTDIAFRVWQTCDCWFGVGTDDCVIQEDTKNYGLGTGDKNVKLHAWKTGSYELIYHTNSNQLDVTYLGDITVANFPGEVSTFVNRQYKVKPDVTLRNGTKVTDVTITVNSHPLPWTSSYATYEQNGTNLVITGNAIGTDDNLTVRYQNNKQPTPYIVERTLKVNVANPIVIQAMLEKDEDNEESTKDDYWSNTGLMHIHFWGSDAETAQDLPMSYNKETKVFSVTAPKIYGFQFMFWYGEDINMSANEKWRKTDDITNCTTNTCYSISYGTSKTETRTATPKSGLCSEDEYYVEITMKNGNTYKSNTISDDLSKEVSFFAPKSNDDTYTGGTVRIVHNGVVSDPITTGFDSAYVYVATINSDANGFATLKAYNGNYYIRTDGAGGMWNDYKTNDDNVMIEFTKRPNKNETYSYYWVKNVAKTGSTSGDKTNVKADVANDINDNLAGMIENDKFTDGGGYVYNSTNGANVRFSYEPTTNEFKRAIISGSGDNNFLNIYSNDNNLFADAAKSKQLNANADLTDSKFNDVSDWVYEKVVYVYADGSNPSNVILKSVYNGQTTHLLGYEINEDGEETDDPKPLEVMGSQSQGDFALRITYDYKKNRLMASWEPGNKEIITSEVVDADVLFIQKEGTNGTIDDIDVAQITYADDAHDAKLTSLKNMMYILEVTSKTIEHTAKDNQEYWITLPFDCRVSDVFGVEDYVKLDANGNAISGTWGILRYDGATRASHGWISESENYWKWMTRDETMKAGLGYVVVFDKTNAESWPSIGVEEPCEGETDGCKDGKKTVQKRIKRLYFPSIGTQFEISYSGNGSSVQYDNNPCSVKGREELDNNWKVLGPVSYNNIGVQSGLTFYYDYVQSNAQGNRYVSQTVTNETILKAFHGYMTQFGGTLTWQPFTKSDDVTGKAPLYAVAESEFKGGMLTVELNNAQGTQLDRTFVNLHKNGTLGFDQNMELTKITENCAQIASISEDVLYAGSTLPLDIELVPLNVKVTANGTYDIALEKSLEGLEVNLFDAFEQTTTPLDMMSATVTLNKGEYKDRFYLQLKQKSGETPTSFDGKLEQYNLPADKTQKLLINDQIYLINAGRIYNATGTMVR